MRSRESRPCLVECSRRAPGRWERIRKDGGVSEGAQFAGDDGPEAGGMEWPTPGRIRSRAPGMALAVSREAVTLTMGVAAAADDEGRHPQRVEGGLVEPGEYGLGDSVAAG